MLRLSLALSLLLVQLVATVLALLSALVPLAASAAALGPTAGARAAVNGLRGYVVGAFGPLSTAPQLLDAALAFWRDARAGQRLGWVFAVVAGINLLWAPSNIMMMLGLAPGSAWPRVRFLLWLAWRAVELAWLVAFLIWVARGA